MPPLFGRRLVHRLARHQIAPSEYRLVLSPRRGVKKTFWEKGILCLSNREVGAAARDHRI